MVSFRWFICSFVKNFRCVMFLLSSLCNKHVAMNRSFRVSLLYLLLLIPQHGNSPLPVMESWLQKDQDDGFVQRDMTSSLTGGDESFGSAHQTYQNSLIRKKKSEALGDDVVGQGFRKFSSKYEQNHNDLFPQNNMIFDGRYVNQEYSASAAENPRSDDVFDQFSSDSGIPLNKLRNRISSMRNQNRELPGPSFKDPYGEKTPLRSSLLSLQKNRAQNLDTFDGNTDWGMCKGVQGSYSPNSILSLPSSLNDGLNFGENLPVENAYVSLEDDRTSRQLANQEYTDLNEAEGKNSQFPGGNEYYETGENTMALDENLNAADYNQMLNGRVYMRKRKEIQPAKPNPSPVETGMTKDISNHQAAEVKTRETDGSPDSETLWNMNPERQTQALNNVVKNSQRVLQQVKQLQQKISYTQGKEEGRGAKREGRDPTLRKNSLTLDEKRLKREDEDEQKNMKTGTDEGGGGEYEDEEGKGHKDEEEYYEDADLSDDESETQIRTTKELNQKYVKREVQDASNKNSKAAQTENNSEDYELNLENAPIENLEKTRKSYREGEKTKKNSVRKGVKIWDQWGKWSPCSVTCGVGRCTRWRHCIGGGCAQGEKEAQIKRCTNPACR